MYKLKKAAILEKNKMAANRGHFRRSTDPLIFVHCYQLAMYQVYAFIIKCTILLKSVAYPPTTNVRTWGFSENLLNAENFHVRL